MINAEHLCGGLTTIRQPIEEIAGQAVRNLVALIEGAPAADCRTVRPTKLGVRRSTTHPLGE